jgi:hypothetical protein
VTGILDRLVDELALADDQVRQAAVEHLKGDTRAALELLDDVALLLADVRADLHRELDEDPEPGR